MCNQATIEARCRCAMWQRSIAASALHCHVYLYHGTTRPEMDCATQCKLLHGRQQEGGSHRSAPRVRTRPAPRDFGQEIEIMSDLETGEGITRRLWPTETDKFRDHLLRLDPESRRLRFAHSVSDAFIEEYAS